MDSPCPLPFVVHLDDTDDPGDVLDVLSLGCFIAGSQPHARTVQLNRVHRDAPLLPPGVIPSRVVVNGSFRSQLATGEGWTLRSMRWGDGSAQLRVTATDEAQARDVLRRATRGAVAPSLPAAKAATIGFWHGSSRGGIRKEREIDADPWSQIRRNYSAVVAEALERVMAVGPESIHGRLLLLHGPPGTGKTSALRALAHAWRRWCRLDYVLDPELLFADPGYLMAAVLGEDDQDDDEAGRWRLLVLEDCDELIRADARQGSGQALSRLLNLTDGLLGQGLNVLVGLTTNEALARLHPAVVRSGRCLAAIEVTRLSRAESSAWLGRAGSVGPDGATLADLFALRRETPTIGHTEVPALVGMYL